MIKITRGSTVLTVTTGAYVNYYKHLGYEPVGVAKSDENPGQEYTHSPEDSQHCSNPTQPSKDEDSDEEDFDEEDSDEEGSDEVDLSEIPLGELSHSQLFEYADQLGLEYEGTPSKKEMHALIKAHLNS